ncbi:terpineol synthase, chloroplastic-like [Salvia hispanica]|uniref:terpineol synthase, chloroplastic-like n=1 Tax=Salvia hispanica TaxID=49212 RepID=UPI002009AFBB|nr:terpineol synthase, chloroplastic-like [Salvia hispanica]
MSSIIMSMAIPNKPTKYVHNFAKKYPKTQIASSQTGWRQSCSLKHTADQTSDQIQSTRRSGNYKPTLWDFDRIQSLTSVYTDEKYAARASELVVELKKLLCQESNWLKQLELIDDLHKLGVSYHFDNEINQVLNRIYLEKKYCNNEERDLYSTALAFRLLRQNGFRVTQDVFDGFKNGGSEFKESLGGDTEGVLQLYEASFLLTEGETSLEQARLFSKNLLQKKLDDQVLDEFLSSLVRRSLELPLHWSVQRPNARWFVNAYSKKSEANPILVELAKLDFNIVQAAYQQELKEISRWWKETELAEKLPFARDRVLENYIWNVGLLFKPQYGYARILTTKLFILITVIDDVFDVYGTLEETQLFKNATQRWDAEAIDQLPYYMQICYMVLDSFINETAYHILKEKGIFVIQDLRKAWGDLCSTYAKEAEWYHTGYKPTMEEYINVAWVSISAPLILTHVFYLVSNPIEKEAAESVRNYNDIIRYSSMVLRLANDLGTSPYEMERGDAPKALECYMNETGASREEAREHVKCMIREIWMKMNGERFKESPFSDDFIRSAADLGRQAQYMYQHGDGHGISNPEMEERISGLIFQPID